MYQDHSGPTLLETVVDCERYPAPDYERGRPQAKGQIPYLDVSATVDETAKRVYLAVINLHISRAIGARVSFDRWKFSSQATLYELHDEDFMAENTFEDPDRLKVRETSLEEVKNHFYHEFRPHSVTVMELHEAKPHEAR
jgi:alpha-L-arabinofuranosidase